MRPERSSERGMALVAALLMCSILVLIISIGTRHAIGAATNLKMDWARTQALNVAEGGVEWAVSRFDPNNLELIATTSPFAGGTYQVTSRALAGGKYALRSTAWVPSMARALSTRSVEVILATGSLQLGPYAIATGGDLSVSGSAHLIGNVHSNQDVFLSGTAHIEGAVSASGQMNPGTYSGASGGVQGGTAQVTLPTFTEAQIQGYAAQARAIATHDLHDPLGAALSGYYQSYAGYDILDPGNTSGLSISISGNTTLALSGIVFIEGSLVLSGNTHLTGSGMIICTQGVRMTGNSEIEGISASSFTIVTLSNSPSAIDLSGHVEMEGILMAPNGGLNVSGSVELAGSVLAGGAGTVTGSVEISYDPGINTSLLQSTFYKTLSYQEF